MKNLSKKSIAFILSLALIITGFAYSPVMVSRAYSIDPKAPQAISFGTVYRDHFEATDPDRYYVFTLPSSGKVTIRAESDQSNSAFSVYIYRDGKTYSSSDFIGGDTALAGDGVTRIPYLNKGKYIMKWNSLNTAGDYKFKIDFTSTNEAFPEDAYGQNDNSKANANKLAFGKAYYGQVRYQSDEQDYFKMVLPKSGKVNIKLTHYRDEMVNYNLIDSEFTLNNPYEPYGETQFIDVPSAHAVTMSDIYWLNAGTYYIVANPNGMKAEGKYKLQVSYANSNETFVEKNTDKEESFKSAHKLTVGNKMIYGQISAEDDEKDIYKFTLKKTTKVVLAGQSKFKYVDVFLFNKPDRKKGVLWNDFLWNDKTGYNNMHKTFTLKKGTYYFVIYDASSPGTYKFRIRKPQYTVKYYKNAGKGKMSSMTVTYGTPKALSKNKFTRKGYKFNGWAVQAKSTKRFLYEKGKTKHWYKYKKQPKGYHLVHYKNKSKISKTTSKDGETMNFYALWKKVKK